MRFDDIAAREGKLQVRKPLPPAPTFTVPEGAGTRGELLVLAQVVVRAWRGKVAGAFANVLGNSRHRLEVTRLVIAPVGTLPEDQERVLLALRTKLGKKTEDRVLRPGRRHALVMSKLGPNGIDNLRPWINAYAMVDKAIGWTSTVALRRQSTQFGILIACHVTGWNTVNPKNHDPYSEGEMTNLLALEVIELESNSLSHAAQGGADDDVAHLADDD